MMLSVSAIFIQLTQFSYQAALIIHVELLLCIPQRHRDFKHKIYVAIYYECSSAIDASLCCLTTLLTTELMLTMYYFYSN